ncbi:DUF5979 domain-containing protein [Bifidobacterium sp. ESL0728]|uniref:DUF5979 domain-containing protein n=1 Tax=Bifidobacterium sp. ESL0728 TaxID=2983220 RepID=UPI0023F9EB4E|nr:DUF5979 domain-containing protein [Bifidobacterium sp. ESL0728]WEV58941.1 DUF5979 domain-containing protein [Bifidobacterium sp. ESL0728]
MKLFDKGRTMKHAAGKAHSANGGITNRLKWLVAMVAAVATLLSGGVIASANSVDPGSPNSAGSASKPSSSNNKVGAQGDPVYQFLNFSQDVYGVSGASPTSLKPGDKFTYQFNLGCSETNCEAASLADQLPAALQGFPITDFYISPSLQANVQWKEGGVAQPSRPANVGANTSFTLTPGQQFVSGGMNKTGLVVGMNGTATLTLQVPADFLPSDPHNKTNIVNSAVLSASNSKSVTSSATVQVSVDLKLEAKVDGEFDPWNTSYVANAPETLRLHVTNTSNINTDKVVAQMPSDAQAGANATSLDADNPFRFFNFDSFGSASLPAGATQVQTDAYIKDASGKWNWVTGVPATTYALPTGVNAANVGGLRFTYTGAMAPSTTPPSPITVTINLKQRASDRNDASNSPLAELNTSTPINAVFQANALQGSQSGTPTVSTPVVVTLKPTQLGVTVGESFDPARHPAGNGATGTVVITNGNSPVAKMEAAVGRGFFSSDIKFDGFKAISYPAGANSGTVVYHMLNTALPDQTVTFNNGDVPAPPSGAIASFDVKFGSTPSVAATNPIPAAANAAIRFGVKSSSTYTFPAGQTTDDIKDANTKATVTAHNTATASATAPVATMTLVKPQIQVTVNKTVSPSGAVPIEHQAVVSYAETTGASTDYLQPDTITVEDSWVDKTIDAAGAISEGTPESNHNNFWNVFDLNAIESTPVPAHTKLTVSVNLPGVGWVELDSKAPQGTSYFYSLSAADLKTHLSAAHSGATPDQVTGIRFKLESDPGSTAFAGSTAIAQYVSFTARDQKRDGTGATDALDAPNPEKPTKYTYGNTTSLAASGKTDEGYQVNSNALDVDSANQSTVGVLAFKNPELHPGEDYFRVDDWIKATFSDPDNSNADLNSVPSLSGKKVTSHLMWGINGDMTSVSLKQAGDVTDYPDAGAHNDMWNDVFDLLSINPIAASDTPYTNGWYLKYDKITQVRVYRAGSTWSTGTWSVVPAPGGAWQNTDRSFKGYTVPASDVGTIAGLEITVEPDNDARTADITAGKPYVPEPGTGVVAAAQTRDFSANWQLRDKKRGTSSFVTGHVSGNDTSHPQPQNVRLDSVRAAAVDPAHPNAKHYIAMNGGRLDIIDYKAAVKEGNGGTYNLLVPPHGVSAPISSYPAQTYDISAANDSPNRASYLRIVTPSECDMTNQGTCFTDNTPAAATENPFTPARVPDMVTGKLDSTSSMPNMFNRQTLTHIDISSDDPSQVSLNDSRVYILRYTPTNYATGAGTFTVDPTITTAAQANAMTEAQLADVVAVAVIFQGSSDPATAGPTLVKGNYVHVKLTTRVRDTLRATNQPFVPSAAVGNNTDTSRATAQIYAPITDGSANDKPTKFIRTDISYRTGSLLASIGETIAPNNLVDVHPQVPQTVTMNANSTNGASVDSSLSPTKVTLTSWPDGQGKDGSSTKTGHFWKNFNFTGLTQLTFPAGATKVKIGVYGPFGPGGAMGWKDGDAQAQLPGGSSAYTMPVTPAQYNDIQGLRFVFTNPNASGNEQLFTTSTDVAWNSQIAYTVVQREHVRDDDTQPVAYPGSEPNAVSSEVESILHDGVNPDQSNSADTSAPMTWGFGQAGLGVSEVANNGTPAVTVGQMVPWDIYFSNIGTGYLDIDKVSADLPAELRYTGQGGPGDPTHPFAFTPGAVSGVPNSGMLTTVPTLDSSNPSKLVFSWPAGKSRMLPGEVVKMTVWLEMEPGAAAGTNVTLPVTVTTHQHLTNLWYVGGYSNHVDPVVDSSGLSIGGRVSDFVTPSSGENIYIVGGVKGSKSGAINTLDPTQTCEPTLTALDGKNYYRAPCRANTAVGGKDDWVLHMVNAGTATEKKVQFFEQLPAKHDKSVVASGDYRGSTYRPELTEAPKVVGAPAGTSATIEASTDTSPCVDTWSTLPGISSTPASTSCSASTWVPSASVTDWSKVTGLRITLDFTGASGGGLVPGKGADVTYTSKNAPAASPGSLADDSDPTVPVSLDQTAGSQEAWAQFGILYTSADDTMHPAAPERFGTRIETGSLKVDKAVGGAAASAYAPQHVRASVTCKDASGDSMLFGGQSHGLVTLNKQHDGTYAAGRLAGIPLSVDGSGAGNTVCTVSEDGSLGQFGETERTVSVNGDNNTGDSDTMNIITNDTLDGSGNPTNAVVAAQSAKITNTYRYSGLSVTKKVDTKADKGSFGPFGFKVACKTSDGQTVLFAGGAESAIFTLSDGQTWHAPADTIPANSTCTVTETDTSAADRTAFTGDNVTDNANGSASVRVGDGSAGDIAHLVATTVTNHYDAGTLSVNRAVSGTGASRYGNVPVSFKAVCDYRGQQLLNEQFGLADSATKSFGVFPAGTQCTITQVSDSSATRHTFLPQNGKVTIATLAQARAADAAAVAGSSVPGSVPGTPTLVGDLSSVTVAETDRYDVGQVPIVVKRTGDESAVQSRGNGPFKIKATCTYQRDGKPVAIDLGGDGAFVLTGANGYSATLDDILLGAHCTVVQTDSAGADSTSIDPANGEETVVEAADKNTVTITDTFRNGPSGPGGWGGNGGSAGGSFNGGNGVNGAGGLSGLGGLGSGRFGGLTGGGANGANGSADGISGTRGRLGQTGAAIAGIAVLIIVLLAAGAIILYMRRRSTRGDESDAALESSANSAGSDGSDDSADSENLASMDSDQTGSSETGVSDANRRR